jgi:hypothetical protein
MALNTKRNAVYNNDDLDRPLRLPESKSKTYTNADLVGQHPADVLDDIDDVDDTPSPSDILDDESESTIKAVPEDAPDTFGEGFRQSLTSGDAFKGTGDALLGYAKGAILDIPSTLYEGAKHAVTHPMDTLLSSMGPLGDVISGTDRMKSVRDTTANAGNDPESFGRLMGNLTGQPAVTKSIPSVVRGAGTVAEGTGRFMRKHTPLTGMPVISPLAGRNLQKLERLGGRGLESVGSKMREFGRIKTVDGKVRDARPPYEEGMELEDGMPIELSREPITKQSMNIPLQEGQELVKKPKVKMNTDGTFTNMETGELFDSKGNPILPEMTKNSKIFKRNRN